MEEKVNDHLNLVDNVILDKNGIPVARVYPIGFSDEERADREQELRSAIDYMNACVPLIGVLKTTSDGYHRIMRHSGIASKCSEGQCFYVKESIRKIKAR